MILRPYFEGTELTVRTNRDPLKWILNLTDSTGRFARLRLCLQENGYDVVHGADIVCVAPATLTHLGTTEKDQAHLKNDSPVFAIEGCKMARNVFKLLPTTATSILLLKRPKKSRLTHHSRRRNKSSNRNLTNTAQPQYDPWENQTESSLSALEQSWSKDWPRTELPRMRYQKHSAQASYTLQTTRRYLNIANRDECSKC